MPNLDIASEKLREIVEDLKKNGLPPVFTSLEVLSDEQKAAYQTLAMATEAFNGSVDHDKETPIPGSKWWNGCLEYRKALQTAIESGLLGAQMVQNHMFDFGAVPDPEFDWKWFYQPDGSVGCWECGNQILAKTSSVSHLHTRKGEFIATVGGDQIGFCPKCDTV